MTKRERKLISRAFAALDRVREESEEAPHKPLSRSQQRRIALRNIKLFGRERPFDDLLKLYAKPLAETLARASAFTNYTTINQVSWKG